MKIYEHVKIESILFFIILPSTVTTLEEKYT